MAWLETLTSLQFHFDRPDCNFILTSLLLAGQPFIYPSVFCLSAWSFTSLNGLLLAQLFYLVQTVFLALRFLNLSDGLLLAPHPQMVYLLAQQSFTCPNGLLLIWMIFHLSNGPLLGKTVFSCPDILLLARRYFTCSNGLFTCQTVFYLPSGILLARRSFTCPPVFYLST